MFVQYSVKNYKSIKDEVIINFSAKKINDNENALINRDGALLYKAIGLVGPNASGKSNILNSLFFSLKFIVNTIKRTEASSINTVPFLLDEECKKESSTFEYIFYEKGIKYVYGFSITSEKVEEEYLLAYYSKKATTIFDRDANREEEYNFRGNDVRIQNGISRKTNKNRLYLPVAAEWGYEKLKQPYDWFVKRFRQYGNFNTSKIIEQIVSDEKRKNNLLCSLQKADFNIIDIYVKHRKIKQHERDAVATFLANLIGENEVEEDIIPEDNPIIMVTHKGLNDEKYSIDLSSDSSGTQSIIDNLAEIIFLNDDGGLIIEDEIGKNFHTKLTEYYFKTFNSNELYNDNIQLVFSTHDTKVLNVLQPEQIYLVDKDKNGATFVKLLDDYIIREKDNIELGYLKGRYGAIPDIKG